MGLQRGLGDEAVVAPYATGLAAMIDPAAAIRNFERLQKLGARGRFGWYEALDFSPARLPEGVPVVPVCAFMAHHQGMILASIANVLKDGMFRTCFHSNSIIQAAELLLQERTPRDSDLSPPGIDEVPAAPEVRELAAVAPRRFTSPHHTAPRTHLLSNGNYSVMLTAAGSGYSRWRDISVTRWREDPTCDPWGSLRVPARCGQRPGLVGRISARRARTRQLRGRVFRRSRRNHPPRRPHSHLHRDPRVIRGRCGGPPGIGDQ